MSSPILAFANYTKDFLLKTDASKEGLGAVLSQKQADGHYHLVTYGSWALTAHEKNYHSTKLEFLVLKWAITEHFKEYLLYQPFLVRTDNNPLMYIMTTPNLDATGHWWVGALAKFNFQLEYQKGQDNMVADVLSQITTCLGPEAVQSILDGVTLGAAQRAEGDDPAMVEGDHEIEKEVCVHCWASPSWNACHQLGCSPKRRPRTRCSIALVRGQKEDWSEDTPGGACFQWGGLNIMEELPKFHGPPRCPLSALHTQRGEWGSTTLCSAKGTSDCHLKWVSSRCGTSRLWPYTILTTRTFLVAQNGQTDETNY